MIKKFEHFDVDPYGEEIWGEWTDQLEGYREYAVNLNLLPTEIWRMDPTFDFRGFSFIFNYNGKNLVYDVIYSWEWEVTEIHIVDRETLYPETYNEESLTQRNGLPAAVEIHGETEESFMNKIRELAETL
jgi:hypothetical protein